MSSSQFRLTSDPGRTARKLFLSLFVVLSFAAYVIYERLTRPDSAPFAASSSAAAASDPNGSGAPASTGSGGSAKPLAPVAAGYKDGTFQGQPIDAYYGLVQVAVNIQGGSIKSVQFLQYPSDRRTSQYINSIAMPYLQQEAIQAQSANVDIVSGATLTSQGFEMSLQSALQAAHN